MESLSRYVLTLVCGAVICAIVLSVSPGGSGAPMRRMMCGLFMAFLAISPLKQLDLSEYTLFSNFSLEAETAAQDGMLQADGAIISIIKEESEAYILDKAEALGFTLEACVEVDGESHLPVAVTLSGSITPYAKQTLAGLIQDDLGIGKEAQTWTQ